VENKLKSTTLVKVSESIYQHCFENGAAHCAWEELEKNTAGLLETSWYAIRKNAKKSNAKQGNHYKGHETRRMYQLQKGLNHS